MTQNLLANSTSPYLLQHADNPVHWRPWGSEALATAQAQNKPILLSIGYAACHWCHVMAHESFENPAIAAVMNDLFVNIKVDREERPDIDQIYMTALTMTGQPGGWPLTMFLTPQGHPFWGGTYFPAEPKYGRPGFTDVLKSVASVFHDSPDKIDQNVNALTDALQQLESSRPVDDIDPRVIDRTAERILAETDGLYGGLSGAPKFPQASMLLLFWHAACRTGSADLRAAVTLAARRMSQGGIYDHLGGGFARYSVDDRWLVPHFEKMLYDNAQLLVLLLLQWQATGERLFSQRIEETITWVSREMRVDNGAFAASLDADSDGEEGKFYVWTRDEINQVLQDRVDPETIALLERTYDITEDGNWEGVAILNRGLADGLPDRKTQEALAKPLSLLFEARATRNRPARDDKILADWNGLMIAALARCGTILSRAEWIAMAERAFAAILSTLSAGPYPNGHRLFHAGRNGAVSQPGLLTDYAAMTNAALALFQATGKPSYLDQAVIWMDTVEPLFLDSESGGYFLTPSDADSLIVRPKSIHDNAEPSANGALLTALARLFHLTGEKRFSDRADALIRAFGGELARNIFPLATFLTGIDNLHNGETVIILGDREDPATIALATAARAKPDPRRMVVVAGTTDTLPDHHPARGKTLVDGKPTAYRCQGMTCFPPQTNAESL